MRCWPDTRYFPDFDGEPSELRVFALVCDRCKELTKIDNVVDEDGYRRIYHSFLALGKVPPRMEDIVLDWELVIE